MKRGTKMKKLLTIIIFVLLLSGLAWAEAPAPFCKAKDYAMQQKDAVGDYVWEFTKEFPEGLVQYALVYLPKIKVIIIAKHPLSCGYFEETGEMKCAIWLGFDFQQVEATQDQVFMFAFKVFRELVSAGAL